MSQGVSGMSANAKYEAALKKIRMGRMLPNVIGLFGVFLMLLHFVFGGFDILLSIIPLAFIASVVWYFTLKCPRCLKTFVPFLTLNTYRWVNPKSCRSCGLPLHNEH